MNYSPLVEKNKGYYLNYILAMTIVRCDTYSVMSNSLQPHGL